MSELLSPDRAQGAISQGRLERPSGPRQRRLLNLMPLGAVVLFAAALRLTGIAWGAPFVYHPDEPNIVKAAMAMVANHDLNPHWFNYPSLLLDLEAGVIAAGHLIFGWPTALATSGLFPSESLPSQFPAYLVGRGIVAAFGVATVVETYEVARQLGGRGAGLVAAAGLAVLPLHVMNSRYVTTDVPMTFFTTMAVLASIQAWRTPGRDRWWVLAAAATGLAASTKWNAAVIGIVPALLYLASSGGKLGMARLLSRRTSYLMVAAGLAGLILPTPAIVASPGEVLQFVQLQSAQYGVAAWNQRGENGLLFQIHAVTFQLPWVAGLLLAAGAVELALCRGALGRALALFAGVYAIVLGSQPLHFERNVLPVMPILLVGMALALARLTRGVRGQWGDAARAPLRRRAVVTGAAAILAVCAGLTITTDLSSAAALISDDTRTLARTWILENVPKRAILARELQTPQFTSVDYRSRNQEQLWRRTLDWYRSLGVNYVITSSYDSVRVLGDPGAPTANAFYEALFALPEVYRVDPDSSHPGYTIRVFRLAAVAGGP